MSNFFNDLSQDEKNNIILNKLFILPPTPTEANKKRWVKIWWQETFIITSTTTNYSEDKSLENSVFRLQA